ncbi:MAG: hypothetical protein ABQ298_15840 [Puniceicoccaceae bacterium]
MAEVGLKEWMDGVCGGLRIRGHAKHERSDGIAMLMVSLIHFAQLSPL